MSNKKFIVKKEAAGRRLDKYLADKFLKISRSQLKKMIQRGLVLVNEHMVCPHYFIKEGEIIHVTYNIKHVTEPAQQALAKKENPNLKPQIIFEDENFLVIDKPAGLLVHATEKNEPETLVSWLIAKYPEIKKVGEQKYRGGIIHRLDRDVSGIMLVVKNNDAYNFLKLQFKNRVIKKEYIALVYGRIEKAQGKIELPIGRSVNGRYVAHPQKGGTKFLDSDKMAKTLFWATDYLKDYTLLRIKILTGRTHQIRVHLSAIGHPILGDKLYKPKKKFLKLFSKRIKVVDPGRILLHSKKIGFYNLDKKWVEYKSPLPQEFQDFIDKKFYKSLLNC